MGALEWVNVAPGVWRARVGPGDEVTLLDLAGAPPATEALGAMPPADFPLEQAAISADADARNTVLRLPLELDEELYGLGLQFHTINQRTHVRHLKIDHYSGQDTGRTHAPCPIYVSSRGYAVLINTARPATVYAGTAVRKDSPHPPPERDRITDPDWTPTPPSDAVEVCVPGASAEVVVFAGPSALDAVRRYVLFSGGGCLPPRWGLGFWHRVPIAYSAAEVEAEAEEFARRGFPLEVIGLEPGWQSRAYPCTYEWDPVRFPEPAAFCRQMMGRGVRVNLWENPYVSPRAALYEKLEPLSGSHTVWCGLVVDYTLGEAREALAEQHGREHLDLGVSGYKIDEVDGIDEWLWPDHATFPSGTSGEVMRQTYAVRMQKIVAEMFRARDRRTYGLCRGSNAGAAAYPSVIYSDYYDHRGFVTALCNSGFLGVLWTPEARGSASGEDFLRRIQTVCFSPMAMINAWADGIRPWSYPDVVEEVREAIRLRARLLPYLYSAFARYRFDGTPPFRAMALEEDWRPADSADVKDQYMMGDSLLVAPMFAGETERQVVLPPGGWCDFHSGEMVEGGRVITVAPGLDRIPLFVRDGGIIPMLAEGGEGLEVRHYGRADGRFMLYDDDGETFAYERGEYNLTELSAPPGAARPVKQDAAPTYGEILWRFMTP
jgi:alpha-D-xyloside xylohydrolase